jgi:hypothetical protein
VIDRKGCLEQLCTKKITLMKKQLLLLTCVSFAFGTQAQQITLANFSTVLTQTVNVNVANNSSFNTALLTTTGNGVTWNASGLTQQAGTPTIHFVYGNPSATPNGSLYPNASHAFYDPALVAMLEIEYLNYGADSVVTVGSYAPNTSHEIYQDPDKHLIFPFNYGQTFTDNYAKTNYSNSTTISSFQTGTRTVTYSGYGSLILPQGTFNNVAMIEEIRTNSLGANTSTYEWFDVSTGKKLLHVHITSSMSVAYNVDMPVTGIKQSEKSSSDMIYPNPFSSNCILRLDGNPSIEKELVISDASGKMVRRAKFSGNTLTIERENLTTGMYYYRVSTQDKVLCSGSMLIE